ncbi:hypothetical protein ACFX13_001774 [Malus domestica]
MHRRAQHEGAVGLPCLDVLQCGTFAVLSGVCELLLQPKQVLSPIFISSTLHLSLPHISKLHLKAEESKGTTGIVDYTNLEDMKCAIKKLDGSEFRNAFDRQSVRVGQGHGEKSTLEMVRCTNMEKARQGKAGILLWMRRPITSESGLGSGSVYI